MSHVHYSRSVVRSATCFCCQIKYLLYIHKQSYSLRYTHEWTTQPCEPTESAAAQRDRLQLDRGGFLEACGGQSVQHGRGQQQGAEVDPLRQKDIIGPLSRLYVVGSSLHGGRHVDCLPPARLKRSWFNESRRSRLLRAAAPPGGREGNWSCRKHKTTSVFLETVI